MQLVTSPAERAGIVCCWCSVPMRTPVMEKTEIKLFAVQWLHTCSVEVLPSLGLNENPVTSSCWGPREEEIQSAQGSNILPASVSKTHTLPPLAGSACWTCGCCQLPADDEPGRLLRRASRQPDSASVDVLLFPTLGSSLWADPGS